MQYPAQTSTFLYCPWHLSQICHMKELVTLRERKLANGSKYLYLDYFVGKKRVREHLKIYLVPEQSKIDKLQNAESVKTALAIKAKRTLELQDSASGLYKPKKNDMLLTDFLQQRVVWYEQRGSKSYRQHLEKIIRWLNNWGGHVTLRTTNKAHLLDFVKFLQDNGLAPTTVRGYYETLGSQFRAAMRDELINANPFDRIDKTEKPKRVETEREYLTMEELRHLSRTKIQSDQVRRAFLFSCFTGLRISDIRNMNWSDIHQTDSGHQLAIRQVKTKGLVYLPLSDNAMSILPSIHPSKGPVFNLPHQVTVNETVRAWVKRARINKHISFHCARHTYATLLLTSGVDIYTVSKLMGHKDVSVTQIYARIIDQKKVDAVNAIPQL